MGGGTGSDTSLGHFAIKRLYVEIFHLGILSKISQQLDRLPWNLAQPVMLVHTGLDVNYSCE